MQAPAATTDSLRRAVTEVFSRPEFQWIERRRVLSWLLSRWYGFVDWLNRLADQHPLGFNIGLGILIVAVALLLTHMGYVIWRIVRPAAATDTRAASASGAVVDAASHLQRAAELARAGRYAEALGHRFLALVLELERGAALKFHVSKTPAEYVGEARMDERDRASFAALVAELYRHLFGAIPCSEGEYVAFGESARVLAARVKTEGRHFVPA